MSNEFDYSNRATSVLVAEIKMWTAYIAAEKDEALLTHYRLHLESARAELAKRNETEVAKRAAEKLS